MTIELLKKIYESEMDVGHYLVLHFISQGENNESELWTIKKMKGFRDALLKKNAISEINKEYIISDDYKNLLSLIKEDEKEITHPVNKKEITIYPFEEFCTDIHSLIESTIQKHTKRKNFKAKSGKMLNSSKMEIKERLVGFFKKFPPVDYELIKRAIVKYTEEAVTGGNKYPVRIIYFLWTEKNGSIVSELLDYINDLNDEGLIEEKEIIDVKKLF